MKYEDLEGYYRHLVAPRLYTRKGLLSALGLCILAYLVISGWYARWLANLGLNDSWKRVTLLGTLAIALMVVVLWWASRTKQPRFRHGQIGVLVAFPVDAGREQTRRVLDELHRQLRAVEQIEVKLVPLNHVPRSSSQAHSLRERSNAVLVVWGVTDEGHATDGPSQTARRITLFKELNFSYRLFGTMPSMQFLSSTVQQGIAGRRYVVAEDNDVLDRDFVARNMQLVVRYVTSISLASAEQFDLAIPILEQVYKDIVQDRRLQGHFSEVFRKLVTRVYSITLALSTRPLGISRGYSPDTQQRALIDTRLTRSLQVDGSHPIAHLSKAITYFWDRKMDDARREANAAGRLIPNESAPLLSLAFLDFYEGHLRRGWRTLKRALESDSMDVDTLVGVIHFYDDVLDLEPERSHLLLPFGMINVRLYDTARGVELLKKFCAAAEYTTDSDMKVLLAAAEQTIRDLTS